ncbi:MAG TPA: TonB family protein [Gemmatimonadales bacterium]|nr:TonB family protein [Gemmatimonadales bacterium]
MTTWRVVLASMLALGAGCRSTPPPDDAGGGPGGAPADQEPPVAINGDSPIQYPPRLYDQKVEGDVVLRLFVDSLGRMLPESSRVAESSGYPALDSAALTGARRLRFAAARRHGLPIATAFLQPVEFRHPQSGNAVSRGEPDTTAPRPAPAPVRAPRPSPPPPPVRPTPRDTTPARRDTLPGKVDTSRARTDTVPAKPDTNGPPH